MYVGLLVYFMHVIIAKFGQFSTIRLPADFQILQIRLLNITCLFFYDVK